MNNLLHNNFYRSKLIKIVLLISLLPGLFHPQPGTKVMAAPEFIASVVLAPTSGPPGTVISIQASGFLTGAPGEVRWDDIVQQTFDITSSSFVRTFTVPSGASAGNHKVTVCGNCYGQEFVDKVDANFNVIIPPTSTLPPPPTPTNTLPPPPTITPTTLPVKSPGICDDLGLGGGAVVIDFEGLTPGQTLDNELEATYGVSFGRSLEVVAPDVEPRSGLLAGWSTLGGEFGSTELPIRMYFSRGLQAIGMFVGVNEYIFAEGALTATLSAFGYRDGIGEVVELGTDTLVFPEEASDIMYCLKVEAGGQDIITFATLEYRDGSGSSAFERRLLDDLTLVNSSLSLPEDLPPVVTITSPTDGQVISSGDVSLTAEIREDRRLDKVIYRIQEGTTATGWVQLAEEEIGFSPAGGDPSLYLTLFNFSADAMFRPDQPYILTIFATDSAGQEGRDQVSITYTPPPTLDIRYDSIEVTQAVQCMNNPDCENNSIPLFQKKPTLVRIYLAANMGPILNVSGHLEFSRDGADSFSVLYPVAPVTVEAVADPVAAFRGDLSRTLNFIIPPELIENAGSYRFKVVILSDTNPPECCYENNVKSLSGSFHQSKSLHIVFIPILIRGTRGNLSEGWRIIDWMRRVYPLYEIHFWKYRGGSVLEVIETSLVDGGCGLFFTNILDSLWWRNLWTDDPEDYMRYYGLVNQSAPPDLTIGCGKTPGDEAAGISGTGDRVTGEVAAHEIGHNHGRKHATACGGAEHPDGSYPVPEGRLDEYGVDVLRMQLYDPAFNYDVMGYCGDENTTWISRYTYLALQRAIGEVANEPYKIAAQVLPESNQQTTREFLIASGSLEPDRVTIQNGFYRISMPADTHDNTPTGPYLVELQDAAGKMLASRQIGPVVFNTTDTGETIQQTSNYLGMFQMVLPWVEGTQTIVFKYNGIEISRRQASPASPLVSLTTPNGGENWRASGTQTISWQATDPDGDALAFTVQYSPDDGQTWTALVTNTNSNTLKVDLANIQGSQNARVRVVASDGLNTSIDISDASFSVATKKPEAYIASPEDGKNYPSNQPIFFQGYATDIEDGPITDPAAFTWRSSRDGNLGSSDQLLIASLSPGKHRITLTVRDSSGNLADYLVTVTIGEQKTLPDFQFAVLIGIFVLAVLVVVVARVLLILKNKRTA